MTNSAEFGDMDARLREISERGGPAQAAAAESLMAAGRVDEAAVAALYDAYLHDPYLTRSERP